MLPRQVKDHKFLDHDKITGIKTSTLM